MMLAITGYSGAIISLFLATITKCVSESLESPCPEIFNYRHDSQGTLYGEVKIRIVDVDTTTLRVELAVGNNVEKGEHGSLDITNDQPGQDIMDSKPIVYKVRLPTWTTNPPKITRITVNENVICSGPIVSDTVRTYIKLGHKLSYPGIPVRTVSTPKIQNEPKTIQIQSNPFLSQPQAASPKKIDYTSNPFLSQSLPVPLKKIENTSNPFSSQTNIYPHNPFFSKTSEELDRELGLLSTSTKHPSDIQPPVKIANPISPPQGIIPKAEAPSNNVDDTCGLPWSATHLIHGGKPVSKGEYPWLGALYHVSSSGLSFACGSSLISERHVVTAAHCGTNRETHLEVKPEEILLIFGQLNLQQLWQQPDNEQRLRAEYFIRHPDYDHSSADADIAVIVLYKKNLKFTEYVLPLCLWREDTDLRQIVGKEGIVAGWGSNRLGMLNTDEPKQTNLPIVSEEECLRSHRSFQSQTSKRTFCAGSRNGDGPCHGDSGGGFIMKRNGRWTLRGVVSHSLRDPETGRCDLSNYVIFTDVSKYSDWLKSIMT